MAIKIKTLRRRFWWAAIVTESGLRYCELSSCPSNPSHHIPIDCTVSMSYDAWSDDEAPGTPFSSSSLAIGGGAGDQPGPPSSSSSTAAPIWGKPPVLRPPDAKDAAVALMIIEAPPHSPVVSMSTAAAAITTSSAAGITPTTITTATAAASINEVTDEEMAQKSDAARLTEDQSIVLLVNLTALSDGALHNRFDKYACSDPEAKRALSRKISASFDAYLANSDLKARGIVHISSKAAWKASLAELRDANEGTFFCPIFRG